jgi:hypothetical protein
VNILNSLAVSAFWRKIFRVKLGDVHHTHAWDLSQQFIIVNAQNVPSVVKNKRFGLTAKASEEVEHQLLHSSSSK